ncbi:choice-of-anchor D domain-containing protein [Wenzhouxiangella limi]|uniref:Choice-of-anchor D domain-containing protein n=1 Tax=Wenzhouxiangella limi TaxID=2707351 RepID=A0A845UZZ5_9GAMM|nr:choice-of-anchor D domain-containing protein [Wenzhouxiangella limi]NDY96044.1 choice-of-anchor D domain-containing protein [Wenzhouxiangella limi]
MTLTLASVTPTASVELGTEGGVSITSGPQSQLALTPDPLAFGTVDLGNMPVTESFTLSNEGEADASNIDVSLAGPDTEFTIASNGCGSTLAAGADCTITIQFNAADNGDYTNAINITSDADVNPNPSAGITGSADSVANLSVTPPFGPVDLGTIVVDTTGTANGSISNSGSAAGDFSCSLTGDPEISTNPTPLSGTVPAGESVPFSLACAVPDTAEEGDTYSASLVCTGDNGFSGTHEISCAATEFEPLPVPTMTNWSIALFALMMLLVGGMSIRFFRT